MKIGILGTGMVGETLGSKLVSLGYEVMMGSRTSNNEKAQQWVQKSGAKASQGTFSDAAQFGEMLFNCTAGMHSLEALKMAGEKNLSDKILVDVANPLDFSKGAPPSLSIGNTDSLSESIQRTFPRAKVVKALNTVNSFLMVNPKLVPGDHNLFVCGNDESARSKVINFIAEGFGWKKDNILDLGDITNARATEALLPIWVRLWGKFKNPNFNFHIVQGPNPQK